MSLKQIVRIMLLVVLITQSPTFALSQSRQPFHRTKIKQNDKNLSSPFCYTKNNGQWDSSFQFIGNTPFGQIGLTDHGIFYHILSHDGSQNQVIQLSLIDADLTSLEGLNPLPFRYHYFQGQNCEKWVTNVPNFTKIRYKDVYPGIDLHYYYQENNPKYEFHVRPGFDPNQIKIQVAGCTISGSDNLQSIVLNTPNGSVSDQNLQVFSQPSGKTVNAKFKIENEHTYSFQLSRYKEEETLVIDPILFGTYISGSSDDCVLGQAVDQQGNVIVTGFTKANDFPTTSGAYDSTMTSTITSAYVAKFSPDLTNLLFSTFMEGTLDDSSNRSYGCEVKINDNSEIIVSGITYSPNFPVTTGAFDTVFNGFKDLVVFKLNTFGDTLLYSTYLGGSGEEVVEDLSEKTWNPMALASDGSVYIAANTDSTDFPLTAGSYSQTGPNYLGWDNHIALCRLSADGSSLLASTYFGGSDLDYCPSLAVDSQDNVILSACTWSTDIPTTPDALEDELISGMQSIFVTKFTPDLSNLIFSTYLVPVDYIYSSFVNIAMDNSFYITFTSLFFSQPPTPYSHFPADRYHTFLYNQLSAPSNGYAITIMNISEDGSAFLQGTMIDGDSYEAVCDVTVDNSGFLYITGYTFSYDFPLSDDAFFFWSYFYGDIFVTRLYPDLSGISFSTYLIGYGFDNATNIHVTEDNKVYIAGYTSASDDFFVLMCNGFDTFPKPGLTGFISMCELPFYFPIAPTLQVTPNAGSFVFSWNEPFPTSYFIGGYALYRTMNNEPFPLEPFAYIWGASILSTIDYNLPPAASYHYAIRAIDSEGNFSPFSTIFDYYLPIPPTGQSALASNNTIKISWNNSSPGSASISHYLIYRSEQSGFVSSTLVGNVSFPGNSFIDNNTTPNKLYYYRIQAVDIYGFAYLYSGICSAMSSISKPVLVLSTDIMKKEYSDNDYINFKVYIYNFGGATASNVIFSLQLPDIIAFVSITGGTRRSQTGNQIDFSVGSIPQGTYQTIDFICQINGKVEKEEKASMLFSVTCDEKVKTEMNLDVNLVLKKQNKASVSVTVTLTNLEQDPQTGKRFLEMGEALVLTYNISGGVPPYKLTIGWGDGNVTVITIDKYGKMSGQLSHKYDARGKVTVKIKIEDSSGQSKESDFDIEIR